MKIAVVGRGRLGTALGIAAQAAGHAVVLLRRPGTAANATSAVEEAVLDADLDWRPFDLVLLAFETHASSVADLERDPSLRHLKSIPVGKSIASVVMSPPTALIDELLPQHVVSHFLTTPAASLSGAIALLPRTPIDSSTLKSALPTLRWIEPEAADYPRLAVMMIGSAIAAAALAHMARALGVQPGEADADYLGLVLDDAKRLLTITRGDGFEAFSLVATPGGFTENAHNLMFSEKWPLDPASKDEPGGG